MNAGLPGTGIAGLFYLLSALFMPVHRTLFGGGHEGRSWGKVIRQTLIVLGILLTAWLMIWGFSEIASLGASTTAPVGGKDPGRTSTLSSLLGWFALFGGPGTLVLVLALVEFAHLVLGTRRVGKTIT